MYTRKYTQRRRSDDHNKSVSEWSRKMSERSGKSPDQGLDKEINLPCLVRFRPALFISFSVPLHEYKTFPFFYPSIYMTPYFPSDSKLLLSFSSLWIHKETNIQPTNHAVIMTMTAMRLFFLFI